MLAAAGTRANQAPSFISPPHGGSENLDIDHDDCPQRYRTLSNLLGDGEAPGLAIRKLCTAGCCALPLARDLNLRAAATGHDHNGAISNKSPAVSIWHRRCLTRRAGVRCHATRRHVVKATLTHCFSSQQATFTSPSVSSWLPPVTFSSSSPKPASFLGLHNTASLAASSDDLKLDTAAGVVPTLKTVSSPRRHHPRTLAAAGVHMAAIGDDLKLVATSGVIRALIMIVFTFVTSPAAHALITVDVDFMHATLSSLSSPHRRCVPWIAAGDDYGLAHHRSQRRPQAHYGDVTCQPPRRHPYSCAAAHVLAPAPGDDLKPVVTACGVLAFAISATSIEVSNHVHLTSQV
ncbi:hypothetical protein E2562_010084 [Oryza meyeriana var. granulata]|uniref:Uncharacterized protein n=1 Tax=Oryza meyeriana var. granulata TaxID=110450 RepID=A0A6G1EI53_9ORYZ|nr:hypothetical protein E2562_010084 [Oryza meyeriana var. granulata]